MSIHQILALGNTENLIAVDAADFDASTMWFTRGDYVGSVDSKSGIFSAWVRLDGGNAADLRLLDSFTSFFTVHRTTGNKFRVFGANAATTTILDISTTASYTAAATWLHVLSSWDLATAGARHIYINDVADLTVTTFTNDTIDYTRPLQALGGTTGGGLLFNGCITELYFAQGQYLDFSVSTNRRKFISSTLKPVSLGSDGSLPTGTAPTVYQHLADGAAASGFGTNLGTGGAWTVNGTLVTCSSSPSD